MTMKGLNNIKTKRSADGEEEVRYCQGRTPCGWALYNKTNRFIYDYMRNRCICEGAKKCHRDQDDISISSYVYRCKLEDTKPGDAQNTPATFPES
ncbi:unnamed protein product [Acanthoscelides obtectus]|uniref:Uncharacterized protein n=1 Tax=Acanthoscelides obtectus TaxID=200917 RepID=A0A9P0LHU0_ACAOB|nr:unnamed protein product [Acanthoscelides obtectus]CAK1672758.1 hypothetical protein AOBTE_LOCUS29076 [Acanthoscelides obtectus]